MPLAIIYREFWDVPRIFIVEYAGRQLLFDCNFDDLADKYPDVYTVSVLPNIPSHDLTDSWEGLPSRGIERLGVLAVKDIIFDPTRRKYIDPSSIERLISQSQNE